MLKVLAGSRSTAVAPQDAQRVGGARLALFPDREPQLFTPTTQHELSLASAAADLPRREDLGPRGEGALALGGQVDRRLRSP